MAHSHAALPHWWLIVFLLEFPNMNHALSATLVPFSSRKMAIVQEKKQVPEQRESNGRRGLQIGVRSLKLRKIKSPLYSKHKPDHTAPALPLESNTTENWGWSHSWSERAQALWEKESSQERLYLCCVHPEPSRDKFCFAPPLAAMQRAGCYLESLQSGVPTRHAPGWLDFPQMESTEELLQ